MANTSDSTVITTFLSHTRSQRSISAYIAAKATSARTTMPMVNINASYRLPG
jgi:hypothetical protein